MDKGIVENMKKEISKQGNGEKAQITETGTCTKYKWKRTEK